MTAQTGIFALGTAAHSYLELDVIDDEPEATIRALAGLREPRTTMGGVNLVAGVRPSLWRRIAPGAQVEASDFSEPIVGPDGFTMPATQCDLFLWLAGPSRDVVFDAATVALAELGGRVTVRTETDGWLYRHDRDLTGFIDGTENPSIVDAPAHVLGPADSTVLLLQRWPHDGAGWSALSDDEQAAAIGRRKLDGEELDPRPDDSHVARTDQDELGTIFRRNTPYGDMSAHGTMFVGFCSRQPVLMAMLESMAGVRGGLRDRLTRFARPETGSVYVIPSVEALAALDGS